MKPGVTKRLTATAFLGLGCVLLGAALYVFVALSTSPGSTWILAMMAACPAVIIGLTALSVGWSLRETCDEESVTAWRRR